jgi:hypothetical protein
MASGLNSLGWDEVVDMVEQRSPNLPLLLDQQLHC